MLFIWVAKKSSLARSSIEPEHKSHPLLHYSDCESANGRPSICPGLELVMNILIRTLSLFFFLFFLCWPRRGLWRVYFETVYPLYHVKEYSVSIPQ